MEPQWARFLSDEYRSFWESKPVQDRRAALERDLRDQKAGSTEVGAINAALDMMDWLENLPAQQLEAKKKKASVAEITRQYVQDSWRRLRTSG